MFSSTLHGLLAGFLFPIMPWFFFRDIALPNFFDADAEAAGDDPGGINGRVAENAGAGLLPSVVFGKRMQVRLTRGHRLGAQWLMAGWHIVRDNLKPRFWGFAFSQLDAWNREGW
jgi:hypothetical protein